MKARVIIPAARISALIKRKLHESPCGTRLLSHDSLMNDLAMASWPRTCLWPWARRRPECRGLHARRRWNARLGVRSSVAWHDRGRL